MTKEAVRCVLLADRHHGITEGVRGLLDAMFEVVVMVANEASLFQSLERLDAELAVVDFALTNGDGLRLIRALRKRFSDLKLIVLSVHDESTVCRSAIDAGANAFVLKRALATDLFAAVDAVRAGQSYVSPRVSRSSRDADKV